MSVRRWSACTRRARSIDVFERGAHGRVERGQRSLKLRGGHPDALGRTPSNRSVNSSAASTPRSRTASTIGRT